MSTLRQTLRRKWKIMLLVGAVLGSLSSSPSAFAAERDGSVLVLSMEDLQLLLSHPSSLSLSTFWPPVPSLAWQERSKAAAQEDPAERSFRWSSGLGMDGYTRPGTRPLWGY